MVPTHLSCCSHCKRHHSFILSRNTPHSVASTGGSVAAPGTVSVTSREAPLPPLPRRIKPLSQETALTTVGARAGEAAARLLQTHGGVTLTRRDSETGSMAASGSVAGGLST